jgi:hypothetical protein
MGPKPFHIALVDLLLDFHASNQSGVIRLERGKVKKQLVIRSGRLAFAESNQPEEHLAATLVDRKLIKKTDLKAVTEAMKAGRRSDDAVLAVCGIRAGDLETGARHQALGIVASLFGFEDWSIKRFQGEAFSERMTNLREPLPGLIVESVRRAVSAGVIAGPLRSAACWVGPADDVAVRRSAIVLDKLAAQAFSLALNPIPVNDLLSTLSAVDPHPGRTVELLRLLDLIRPTDNPRAPTAPRAPDVDELHERVDTLLQQFEVANLYEVLSVPTDAPQGAIKAAYHELARQYHPDQFQSERYSAEFKTKVEKLFTFITAASTTLADAKTRAAYDEKRASEQDQLKSALDARSSSPPEKSRMAETLYRAARAAMADHDYETAVRHLRECVWACPHAARYYHHLGIAETELPQCRKDAEKHLLKAIELDAAGSDSRLALGRLYVKVNLARRAEAQFEDVLRWDPKNVEARQMLDQLTGSGS